MASKCYEGLPGPINLVLNMSLNALNNTYFRYQYYLQLKSDVIDSKLPCSTEKAVLLAAYSVQGEYTVISRQHNFVPQDIVQITESTGLMNQFV